MMISLIMIYFLKLELMGITQTVMSEDLFMPATARL